jgi:hypothetical protein
MDGFAKRLSLFLKERRDIACRKRHWKVEDASR